MADHDWKELEFIEVCRACGAKRAIAAPKWDAGECKKIDMKEKKVWNYKCANRYWWRIEAELIDEEWACCIFRENNLAWTGLIISNDDEIKLDEILQSYLLTSTAWVLGAVRFAKEG